MVIKCILGVDNGVQLLYTTNMQKYTDKKQPRTTQIIFGETLPIAKQMAKRSDVSVSKYIRDLVKKDHARQLRRERQERQMLVA